jgi:hypothetical protein
MALEFRCNQCEQLLRVPDDSAGKHARCPKCQALMAVPMPAAGELPVPVAAATTFAPEVPLPPSTAPVSPENFPVAPIESTVAPNESNSPFAPGPVATAVPAAAPPGNPFGEVVGENPFSGPSTANLNPYASPAGFASYQPTHDTAGLRLGLPWDTERRTFGCWFRTVRIILGMPNQAFLMMHQHGGLGPPIRYSIYGIGMPAAAAMVLAIPILLVVFFGVGPNSDNLGELVLGISGILLFAIVYVLVAATVGNLITSAILHVSLMLVGGARQPFETTFRVTSYVYGSLMALTVLPYIGCVAQIWLIVLLIIGLAKAHDTTTGKAVLAVLLPVAVCIGGYFFFIFSFILGPALWEGLGR